MISSSGSSTARGDVLLVGAGSALWGGLLSALWPIVSRAVTGRLSFMPLDGLWLAPAGMAALFAGPALLLAAAAGRQPRWRTAAIVLLGGTALWSVLLRAGAIHPLASLLLSLGAAWRLGEMARRDAARWRRGATWLAAAGLAATLVAASGVSMARASRESQARRSRAPAAAGAPNVLLLIIDTQRPGELGAYGSPRGLTPHLDSLAGRGAVFETAIAPSSWTLPSHASMFTGLPPNVLAADWLYPLQDTIPTLGDAFRGLGYRTALLGGNHNYVTEEAGLARGFEHFVGWKHSLRQTIWATTLMQLPPLKLLVDEGPRRGLGRLLALDLRAVRAVRVDRQRAPDLSAALLHWVDQERRVPFFAAVNYFDVHEYSAPRAWLRRHGPDGDKRGTYRAALAYTDDAIGTLLRGLHARGVLGNTIVVLTSDHGEQWGEHGLQGHGNSVYSLAAQVPLLIAMPEGRGAGRRVRTVVSLTDLGASLLGLAAPLTARDFPGRSFASLLDGGDTSRVAVCYLRGDTQAPGPPRVAVFDERRSYIRDDAAGTEEVFAGRVDTLASLAVPAAGVSDPAVAAYRRLAAGIIAADPWLRPSATGRGPRR